MTERVPAAGSLAGAPDRARRAAPPRTGAEHLSEYCARLSWDALDASVRTRTKELLLDHIGVAIGGLAMESTRAIHAFLGRVADLGLERRAVQEYHLHRHAATPAFATPVCFVALTGELLRQ